MQKVLKYLIRHCIYFLFLLIIVWLVAVSGFSTSYINISTEYTYFVSDNVWEQLIVVIMFLILMYGIGKSVRQYDILKFINKYFLHIKYLLLFLIGVVGVIIVICTQTIPWADQMNIMVAAHGLKYGDYSMFMKGGYIQQCQNQSGIVLFLYFLSLVFGDNNYIVFQILNILALVLVYKELAEIVEYFGMGKISQLVTLIFGVIFLPFNFYTTFVYGTITSFALALFAIKHELLYFSNFKWKEVLLSSIAITLSIVLKNNSLIIMIAMIIYAMIKLIDTYKSRTVILIILIVLLYLFQNVMISSYIGIKTGQNMERGISSWAYIAMGLQEGNKADGWWNGYNSATYRNNDCNSDKQADEAKSFIKERLRYFIDHKEYAIGFIGHKLASQWNNPTFQCCWIVNMQTSNIEQPDWMKKIYSVSGQDKIGKIFNLLQFIILMGCLIFVIFDCDKMNMCWLFLQMVIIGGFLFHILWEAKCQYTLPYFLLLVPMAIKGYDDVENIVINTHNKISNKQYINRTSMFIILFVGILVYISFSKSIITEKMVKIDDNAEAYSKYVQFNTTDKIEDGNYGIYSFMDEKLSIICLDLDEETSSDIALGQCQQDNIYITTKNGRVYFRFNGSKLYLDLNGNKEIDNGLVWAHIKNDTNAQKWVIKRDKQYQNIFYILIGSGSALTYDNENGLVCIKEFNGCDTQKWIIK